MTSSRRPIKSPNAGTRGTEADGRGVGAGARRPQIWSLLAHETGVDDRIGAAELDALVADRAALEVVEEPLTAAEQDGHDRQVHLVHEAGPQVLLDRGCATAEPDVPAVGSFERSIKGRFDALGDEVERRPALHGDRCPRVMG